MTLIELIFTDLRVEKRYLSTRKSVKISSISVISGLIAQVGFIYVFKTGSPIRRDSYGKSEATNALWHD